jgi:hypothetical protein
MSATNDFRPWTSLGSLYADRAKYSLNKLCMLVTKPRPIPSNLQTKHRTAVILRLKRSFEQQNIVFMKMAELDNARLAAMLDYEYNKQQLGNAFNKI